MLDAILDSLSGSPWTYAMVLAIVAADAVVPVFPGETAIITAAVLARAGDLAVPLVFLAALAGAVLGDTTSYGLGRGLGDRAIRRLARGEKARGRVEWSRDQLRRRGPWLVVVARFIPGGRTTTTLAAGSLGMPFRRFAAADAAGATLWSAYATALGWFGGQAFTDSLWKPLLLALAVGGVIAVIGEVARRLLDRREPDARPGG